MVSNDKLSGAFRAKNHELRQRLLDHLAETGGSTVTEIFIAFKLEQSVASQHLAILRESGLVKVANKGKFRVYQADANRLGYLKDLEKAWAAEMQAAA